MLHGPLCLSWHGHSGDGNSTLSAPLPLVIEGRAVATKHRLLGKVEKLCMMGRSGSGFVPYRGNEWFSESVPLGEWAPVFQAKTHTLTSLANSLISRELHGAAIDIFTDS